jgi:mRNA-degrading endonuclease toxin of MazEF toxin-antitoxin module
MFPIDRRKIKRDVKALGERKKYEKGLSVKDLADSYKMSVWNMMDMLQEKDAYTMLNWVVHVDRWIENFGIDVRTKYKRGDIVFVEWGAMNFGFEPSYEHPGLVIANAYNTVLVAPCSSQTFGKGHKGVFDLPKTGARGLKEDTGVSANAVRWISKNRIVDHIGSVLDFKILDQVEEYLMNQLFFTLVVEAYHENEIFDLNRKMKSLNQQLMEIKNELRSFYRSVEELLQRRAPELLDAYRQVASSAPKIP